MCGRLDTCCSHVAWRGVAEWTAPAGRDLGPHATLPEPPALWRPLQWPFRLGMRKPAGTDFRKRRYWAFGGSAGAWRIFVEIDEGRQWGW